MYALLQILEGEKIGRTCIFFFLELAFLNCPCLCFCYEIYFKRPENEAHVQKK